MKNLSTIVLLGLCALFSGCATTGKLGSMTSAQALTIAQPVVSAGLTLVLDNNPSYIPIATKVGADLTAANYTDLTTLGINSLVTAAVTKEGGTPQLAAIVSGALDAGVAGYLVAVGETALTNDPNAVPVLQALGTAISAGAAAATPK